MVTEKKKPKSSKPRKKRKKPQKEAKKTAPAEVVKKTEKSVKRTYLYAVGRRKSAVARVRYYYNKDNKIIINDKDYIQYFPYFEFQKIVQTPLTEVAFEKHGLFSIKVKGGGKKGQAESIRLGIARILIQINKDYRGKLKRAKLLKRDARVKERKKYGLKRARRAPQWQKR